MTPQEANPLATIRPAKAPARDIEFVFVKSELGAGTYGPSLGIEAIQLAAASRESAIFKRYPATWIVNESEDIDYPPFAHNIDAMHALYGRIARQVKVALNREGFPLILAGDHCSAGGTIAGLRMADPTRRLGVIWIDAHADINTPYTTPSGNMHGMPLGISLDMTRDEWSVNDIDGDSEKEWDHLCGIGGISPKISPEDLVFIGLRSVDRAEQGYIDQHNVKVHTVEEVRSQGAERIVAATLEYLAHCDMVYVSFDIDSLDAALVPGTGTPVAGGLTEEEAAGLLTGFWQSPKLAALEFCEINPLLDIQGRTPQLACRLLEAVLLDSTRPS